MKTIASCRVLSGYKDIASFMGVSVKTIQRNLKSMPVAKLGAKIIVLESDLICWIKKRAKLNRKCKQI